MNMCPLCLMSKLTQEVNGPDSRLYNLCNNCKLIFTNTRLNGNTKEDAHNANKLAKSAKLMQQLKTRVLTLVDGETNGLCYGAGVGSDLEKLFKPQGIELNYIDSNYLPADLDQSYDLIIAIGAIEDFFLPAKEFQLLRSLVSPTGKLVMVTEKWEQIEKFRSWAFAKNPGHVSFYHNDTFAYICQKYGFSLLDGDDNKIITLEKVAVAVPEELQEA